MTTATPRTGTALTFESTAMATIMMAATTTEMAMMIQRQKKSNRCRKLILKLLLKYVPLDYKTLIIKQKTGRNPGQYRGYIHLTFQQQKKMLSTTMTTVTTILFYSVLLIDRITN